MTPASAPVWPSRIPGALPIMSDLPMIEPATVAEAYDLVQVAFDLSERIGTPVFVRLVTALANSHAVVEVDDPLPPPQREPILERDIARYTKAGSVICLDQHRDLIARLAAAGEVIGELGLNQLQLSPERRAAWGCMVPGQPISYLDEGFEIASRVWASIQSGLPRCEVRASHPFPARQGRALLDHCDAIVVLEELEPYLERALLVEAHADGLCRPYHRQAGWHLEPGGRNTT